MSAKSENNATLDRRALLLGAVFLVGGAAALTRLARRADTPGAARRVFSPEQFALLEQVCEAILPTTDSPGAIDAGVPAFIREMLTVWATDATHAEVIAVLGEIEKQSWQQFGAAFLELPMERRLDAMRAVDSDLQARADAGYSRFKWLVLVGYYQSEIGATQELRYELVPGAWRACLPLEEVGRASAV